MGQKMNDKALMALNIMADRVNNGGNCVLELIIGENGMLAHLIPLEAWEQECEEGKEEDF